MCYRFRTKFDMKPIKNVVSLTKFYNRVKQVDLRPQMYIKRLNTMKAKDKLDRESVTHVDIEPNLQGFGSVYGFKPGRY